MRTKRPKVFRVSRGHLYAEGATKAEAKAKLESMIDWALNVASPVVEKRHGLIIVIASTPNGYCSHVLAPADLAHGQQRQSMSQNPQGDYGAALQSARNHAAQNAWSPSIADDSEFVARSGLGDKSSELFNWIGWQRRYAAAKANGATDAAAHEIASGMRRAA